MSLFTTLQWLGSLIDRWHAREKENIGASTSSGETSWKRSSPETSGTTEWTAGRYVARQATDEPESSSRGMHIQEPDGDHRVLVIEDGLCGEWIEIDAEAATEVRR